MKFLRKAEPAGIPASSAPATSMPAAGLPAEQPQARRNANSPGRFLVPMIVGCALFMETLDSTVITTALPVMAKSLHEDPIRLNLAITAYLLSLAVFIPISGWMADRFGARSVFRSAIVVFTVGSVLCGLSHTLPQLVAARILQGSGGAMMVPVGRLLVLKSVPKSDWVIAMSYLTVPAMLGPVVGPPLGGYIVTYYSWHWIFFINVPVCMLGFLMITLFIGNVPEDAVAPLDFIGFMMTGVGLATLVFGFEAVGRGVIPLPLVLASMACGAGVLGLYAVHARRTPRPIIDLRLLKIQTFSASTVGGGLFRMGIGAMPFLLALLLQIGFGLSPFVSGLLTFASAAGSLTMKFTVHLFIRKFGFRRILVVNGIVCAATVAMCVMFQQTTPFSVIIVVLLVGGFFRSLQFTSLGSLAYADVTPGLMSNASSLAGMAQQLFMSIGVAFAAMILRLSLTMYGATTLHAREISPAFVIMAALSLLSTYFFIRLPADAGYELSGHRAQVSASPLAQAEPAPAVD